MHTRLRNMDQRVNPRLSGIDMEQSRSTLLITFYIHVPSEPHKDHQ